MQENFLVQVAVAHEVDGTTEIPDNQADAVCAVCNGCRQAKENHEGEAQGGAAACDAVDKAYHCA